MTSAKPNLTTIVVAALSGAILAAVPALVSSRGGAPAAERAGAASDEGRESAEFASIEGRLVALAAQVSSLKTADPLPVTTNATSPAENEPEVLTAGEESQRQHLDDLAEKFRQEPKDGVWAASAEGIIRDIGRSTERMLPILSADCRTELCRVELPEGDAIREGLTPFAMEASAGDFGSVFVDEGADASGRPVSILYLARRRASAQ